MDNSEYVQAGSPEWFIMKKFAKTLIMVGAKTPEIVNSLVSEYNINRKKAWSLAVSASFDLNIEI